MAKAQPLGVNFRRSGDPMFRLAILSPRKCASEIVGRYGKDALYEGGLSVRATLDPRLQAISRARRCSTA
jgi:penicillin-binding protein 1A